MTSSFHLFRHMQKSNPVTTLRSHKESYKKITYFTLRYAGIFSLAKHEEDTVYNIIAQVKHKGKDVTNHSSRSPKSSHRGVIHTVLMLLLFGLQRGLAWRRVLSSRSATICRDSANACCSLLMGELVPWRRQKVSQSYEMIFLE